MLHCLTVASSSFPYIPKFHPNSVYKPYTFQFCWFLLSPWVNKLFTAQSQSCDFTFLIMCMCLSYRSAHSLSLHFCNFSSYVSQGSAHSRFIQSWARVSGASGDQRDGERLWLGWLWQKKRAWRMTAALASHFHSLSLASPSICFLVIISSLRISNAVDFLELCSFVSSDLLLLLSSANFPFRVLCCFSALLCTQTQPSLPNKWKVR